MVQFAHIIALAAAGFFSLVGIYVKFSNEMALARLRIQQLEKQAEQFDARINTHDDKIQGILLELKNDISELKLLIEQRMKVRKTAQ